MIAVMVDPLQLSGIAFRLHVMIAVMVDPLQLSIPTLLNPSYMYPGRLGTTTVTCTRLPATYSVAGMSCDEQCAVR